MYAKMSQPGSKTRFDSSSNKGSKSSSASKDKKDEDEYPPLESRVVECKSETGVITKVPALNKRWAPSSTTKWIQFYLPDVDVLDEDESVVMTWVQYMEMFIDDLKWLLQLSHYQFWSVMVYTTPISQEVLQSFLLVAPRFYDASYSRYERNTVIWPMYKEIYVLVFRVFMRLATYKESKEDHITPSYWITLLHDNSLISIPTLMTLSTLYESKDNPLFSKIVDNLMKNDSRLMQELRMAIPVLMEKFNELSNEMETLICENLRTLEWNPERFDELLWFKLDTIYSIYKFLKVYNPAASTLLRYPNFVSSMASSYEINAKRWGKVLGFMPNLEDRVSLFRAAMLRLFRAVLATPTILIIESANDKRLDEFFECFASCIDEKVFIHDYEKSFPFRSDMQSLLSRGIFVDETRIDYMANAISACFHACGEEYSVEKIVVDPLYDPNFDRQLLGACSLEVTGIELESLITQVKDLLPDLPNSYVEAVLKHYGYITETTINALLEGSVPSRLEKYKNEDYVKSQSTQSIQSELEDPVQDKLPVQFNKSDGLPSETSDELGVIEKFYAGKRSHGFTDSKMEKLEKDIKARILERIENPPDNETLYRSIKKQSDSNAIAENQRNNYIDESLLPSFNEAIEYDDEYDDTYDDVGGSALGMTEPDNLLFNPLNRRKVDMEDRNSPEDQIEEPEKNKNFDAFCEDPSIVRARFERRREEMHNRRGGHHAQSYQPQQTRDVVGREKGQGQDKDVLYNRRQKTMNKGAGGSFKKRSDFKRKEF